MIHRGAAIALRVLLGFAACGWAWYAWFAALFLGGLGAPDLQVALLVATSIAGLGGIAALFISGPWSALLVVAQVAGLLAVSFMLTGHAPADLWVQAAMSATVLLATIVAWQSRDPGRSTSPAGTTNL